MHNAIDPTFNTGLCKPPGYLEFTPCFDAFVTKLDDSGNLVYSTYIGADDAHEYGLDIAVGASGSVTVVGTTTSSPLRSHGAANFPTTPGALKRDMNLEVLRIDPWLTDPKKAGVGVTASFVLRLTPSGGAFEFSTFFWGEVRSVALTTDEEAVVVGVANVGTIAYTHGIARAPALPFCQYDPDPRILEPLFCARDEGPLVAKLNATGTALVYASFLAQAYGEAWDVAVDARGNAYVVGGGSTATDPTRPSRRFKPRNRSHWATARDS